MRQRILVVGGVAAGPSAASKAKRVNPNADVLLLEQGEHISYGICEIPYYVGKVVTDPNHLVSYTPQKLEQAKGVEVKTLHRVEEIVKSKKKVIVRNLARNKVEEHPYSKLIIATGSKARKLGIQGEDAVNVFHVKTLEDGYALRKYMDEQQPKRAVIIGGGYIGMEMAEALISNNITTTLLHRGDMPMSGLEEDTRKAVVAELESNGVQFVPRSAVKQLIRSASDRVTQVVATSGAYDCDLVILSLGVEPNTELAQTARIQLGGNGGIVTDQRQNTSVDAIYAAGDCCEVKNIVNNKWMYIPLATIASRQAWVAGENAAGGSATFKGAIRAIAVKVFRLEVAQVGISSEEADASGFRVITEHIVGNSKVGFYPGNAKVHIVAIADKRSKRLLGANVFGEQGVALRADVLGVAIKNKMTVEDISRLDLLYTPPFAPLWDPVLVMANQLKKKV
ncbi:MAG: FAD-dependent oxidoreductase [Ignavibacteriae bacterium]|nr:FAD-dependent oxidoreductase [Ignavibacteriota bacterium]